ncbi:hypothetical protein [Mucilaginibacter auburnensis]|uniref:hypothetical protein n=1 Tax=Mucilaginibacter auburnensis TaxID=1457233 RepID=UPI0012FDFD35|nr:hypothetical protein [Mucilaginibacter auburnensis]
MLITIFSCKFKEPFNKVLWDTKEDIEWPYRDSMLEDLTKNHQLVGLKYKNAIDLLGDSNYHESDISLSYDIITDYGSDIDPVYIKTLELKFDKDSVLSSFQVKEWRND